MANETNETNETNELTEKERAEIKKSVSETLEELKNIGGKA